MRIAVIPARGGSKRIPRKNIKLFCGKPMIAWALEVALDSGLFDHVVVSTDDPEIASVARHYGAIVPFMRPANLSDDFTGTTAVIAHSVDWYMKQGYMLDHVCCIYATAPFITVEDLRCGIKILTENDSDFTMSVTSYAFPIHRSLRLKKDSKIEMIYPEYVNTRSQDLEEAFHDAGQFYWGVAKAWLSNKVIFGPNTTTIRLPRHRVQDIDDYEDWERAEYLFKIIKNKN